MIISEIFGPTIQGEGIYSGVPSIFIRTCGCNLRCHFRGGSRCDTPYTSINVGPDDMNLYTPSGVLEEVHKLSDTTKMDIVITGGEPMTQQKDLSELVQALIREGHRVTIETNGTIVPQYNFDGVFWSVSPKLKSSCCFPAIFNRTLAEKHERTRINIEAVQAFVDTGTYQLKFVVASEAGVEDVLSEYLNNLKNVDTSRVLLMPAGATRKQLEEVGPDVVRACIKYGFRFCDRTHIRIWDSLRGV